MNRPFYALGKFAGGIFISKNFKEAEKMQNLKRNINMGFRVNEDEQEMIRRRMGQTGIRNLRAYLLKMVIDGFVVNLDLSQINECSRLLSNVSNNINQIAKHANTIGAIHGTDMETIKARLDDVWEQQNKIIRSLAKIVEVA